MLASAADGCFAHDVTMHVRLVYKYMDSWRAMAGTQQQIVCKTCHTALETRLLSQPYNFRGDQIHHTVEFHAFCAEQYTQAMRQIELAHECT